MKPPTNIDDLKEELNQYHVWFDAGGPEELRPEFMKKELEHASLPSMLLGLLLHIPLWLLCSLSLKIKFWPGLRWFSLLRIRTDHMSFESSQCGLNAAYTFLGIGKLKSGDIEGATFALKLSGLVWPCPHSTSFGLRKRLANELGEYSEAKTAVNEYKQLADLFSKSITQR